MRRFRIDFTRPDEAQLVNWHYVNGEKAEYLHVPSEFKAQGIEFGDKSVVVAWVVQKGESYQKEGFASIAEVRALNDGNVTIRWEDPICWMCEATLTFEERAGGWCTACGAGQGKELCFDDFSQFAKDNREAWEREKAARGKLPA